MLINVNFTLVRLHNKINNKYNVMKACTISISNKQKSWPMWHVSNINNACPFFFCWKLLRTIATHWPCLFQGPNHMNENVNQ